jgi:hypothetical protein
MDPVVVAALGFMAFGVVVIGVIFYVVRKLMRNM